LGQQLADPLQQAARRLGRRCLRQHGLVRYHRRQSGTAVPRLCGDMSMQIAPSILAADFARLADEAAAVAGAPDPLHLDVMDGHCAPHLSPGARGRHSLLKAVSLPVDCHLMIEDPDRWAPGYAEAGARNVTIHAEAAQSPVRTLREIRAAGARAGLGINPATP